MTTRHVRNAVAASVLTVGMVALAPVIGRAQNSTAIPEKGQRITMVGCFTRGVIGSHERYVLAKPIVGSVASVPEATCTASGTDQMIKLQDLSQVKMGAAQLGRWVEIYGRLEGNHRADAIREVHVKSFSLVPVVVPPPAVAMIAPAPAAPPAVEAPPAAPQIAENAWTPPPMPTPAPVGTSGHRKSLPKTATNVPFFGLIGFLSIAAGFTLRLFNRRDVEHV